MTTWSFSIYSVVLTAMLSALGSGLFIHFTALSTISSAVAQVHIGMTNKVNEMQKEFVTESELETLTPYTRDRSLLMDAVSRQKIIVDSMKKMGKSLERTITMIETFDKRLDKLEAKQ
jgi:hypothetical protein